MVVHVRALRKPRTAAGYQQLFDKHINPSLGARVAIELTRKELLCFHPALGTVKANHALALLISLYSFGAKNGYLPEGFNPAKGIAAQSPFVIVGLNHDRPRADLNKPWRSVRRRADLERVRMHDLRYTFASIGAGASFGLPIVGKLLSHSQPQRTARCAHLDADPLRCAANTIGDHLTAALSGIRGTSSPSTPTEESQSGVD
jgi:hypothetical protein